MRLPDLFVRAGLAPLLTALALAAPASGRAATAEAVFPSFDSPAALAAACEHGLQAARRGLHRLERRPADGGWLRAYDRYNAEFEDASAPLAFLSAVHPDRAMRDASEACEQKWNAFNSTLTQNPSIYRALTTVRPADAIDRELLRVQREAFEDSGVKLRPAQRAEARRLNDRMAELGQRFEQRLRDAGVRRPYGEDELAGVPPTVWRAAPRDAEGRVLLGVDSPTFDGVLRGAASAAARERMWRAKMGEGGTENIQVLNELVALRKQYATLMHADSWRDFVIRRRMAGTPQRVSDFLDAVDGAVREREQHELAELRAAKAAHLQQPLSAVQLDRWDLPFYSEQVRRQRYTVDQEAMRPYFPAEASLDFVLRVVERVLGVRYERLADQKLWHPDVRAYAVRDAASGERLGSLLIDPFPREGKYGHAAVWGLRNGSAWQHRLPLAALVCNVDAKGLTLDELKTLLHELGHAVHDTLTRARWQQQAGAQVVRDFVEAPSQMLEDWVYDKAVLRSFAEVCPSCKPLPEATMDQALAARRFGRGQFFARQVLFARYDLALHGPTPPDALALWATMEGETPMGTVPGTMFPGIFVHLASGYPAAYYGYLWSLVVAADLRTAFGADKFDAAVGARYRRSILARGAEAPPDVLVRAFLGRDFNSKAFFDELAK